MKKQDESERQRCTALELYVRKRKTIDEEGTENNAGQKGGKVKMRQKWNKMSTEYREHRNGRETKVTQRKL